MILKTGNLNGKNIGYTDETVFLVQVGFKTKGAYKTRYRIVGNLAQAVMYYNCINIGRGYKKRLLMPSANKPVMIQTSLPFPGVEEKEKKARPASPLLARQFS